MTDKEFGLRIIELAGKRMFRRMNLCEFDTKLELLRLEYVDSIFKERTEANGLPQR